MLQDDREFFGEVRSIIGRGSQTHVVDLEQVRAEHNTRISDAWQKMQATGDWPRFPYFAMFALRCKLSLIFLRLYKLAAPLLLTWF